MKMVNNIVKTSLLTLTLLGVNLNATNLEKFLEENKVFVSGSVGYSNLHMSKKDISGSVNLSENINSGSKNITLETGLALGKNVELALNYQRVDNDDVNLDNIYFSLRYKFLQESFIPYVGANLGYSQLSWQKKPIATPNNDTNSGTYLIGGVLGMLYPIDENLSLDISYQANMLGHKTYVESFPNSSDLEHDFLHSFNIGLRFSF